MSSQNVISDWSLDVTTSNVEELGAVIDDETVLTALIVWDAAVALHEAS